VLLGYVRHIAEFFAVLCVNIHLYVCAGTVVLKTFLEMENSQFFARGSMDLSAFKFYMQLTYDFIKQVGIAVML
jgi:biotin transporter BioY